MTTVPSNLVPIRVTDLPVAPIPEPTGTIPIVIGGILYQVRFIDVQSTVSVPSTRTISTGGGLTGGGDLSQDRTISLLDDGVDDVKLTDSGVTAGVYGGTNSIPVITVNSKGRVTDVTLANIDFTGYVPDTRQIFAGTGLTGGGALTANRTLSIDFSTATPLSLGSATAGTGVKAAREDHVHPAVDLADATEANGILPLTNGGTGMQVNNLVAGAIWYTDGSNGFLQTTQGNLGQVLVSGASGAPSWGSALIMSDQPANYVYAGPASGPAAPTAFRALVNADIPSTLTGKTMSGSLNTFSNIPNTALTNSSVTFNGVTVALGASGTITATATNALTIGTGLSGTSYNGSTPVTIAISDTGVVANTYGSASAVPVFAVNAQGQLTSVTNTSISIASSAITDKGLANGIASLDAGGTVPLSQIPASIQGGLIYQGTWNAATNTPTLTSGVGSKGHYYVVSVAGTTNLDGITDWNPGDMAVFNGTVWEQVDNTDAVTSVNGFTGAVVLTTTNVAEGTNLYYTDARARAAISVGTGLSYSSSTGVIDFSNSAVATWAATPSSANLAAAMTDETGTGSLVFATGPTLSAPTIDGPNPYIQFADGTAVTVAAGKQWYNGTTGSWNLGMGGGNVTQQVGEEFYRYGKASTAISGVNLQLVYKTGVVGASGVITFAPTIAGLTDPDQIIGVATETIALNGFGRVTTMGIVRGIDTTGTVYGETWADNDDIWYNPVTGGLTKTKPVAPNMKLMIGTVINAGSSGSGSFNVHFGSSSTLGGTDSNVQVSTVIANDSLLQYYATGSYWRDVTASSVTVGTASNLALGVAGAVPYQSAASTTGFSATGNAGEFLISGGTGAPTWTGTISGGTY